jgi:5-methyltetrahydropteroyltriglutamate--homocysteine methyltransferase
MIRYRADHVGSLLRPNRLLEAHANPATTPEQLKALEDEVILQLLAAQRESGLRIFTDGEVRRRGFMSDFYDSVEGVDSANKVAREWKVSAAAANSARPGTGGADGIVYAKLRQTRRLTRHETVFLKQHSPGDIKMTLPTANQFPAIAYKAGITDKIYQSRSELLWDIVPIIRDEIRALVEDGVKYVQIDAPRYSYYIDPKWRGYIRSEMGMDPDAALDEAIQADNACLKDLKREGVTVAIHLCRGNNRSQWYAEGGYDPIAEKLFSQLDVDLFLLEYDSERAGSFEPLRFVPEGKGVVLGLVSTKNAEVECADVLIRRIEEARRFLPLERLALSPQCGFASAMEGNLLTEADQWAKLKLVVDTASQVWPEA